MYAKFVRSESRLVVVVKVSVINEIIDTVKNCFSNILEQMDKRNTGR